MVRPTPRDTSDDTCDDTGTTTERQWEPRSSLRAGSTGWIPPQPPSCTERCTSSASVARGAQRASTHKRNDAKPLKHELRRLGETGQRSGRSVEHPTSAEFAFGAAVKHYLARAASEHANEPAALLELIDQRRRNPLGRSFQQDHIIRGPARVTLRQRACHNLHGRSGAPS